MKDTKTQIILAASIAGIISYSLLQDFFKPTVHYPQSIYYLGSSYDRNSNKRTVINNYGSKEVILDFDTAGRVDKIETPHDSIIRHSPLLTELVKDFPNQLELKKMLEICNDYTITY